MYVSFVKIPSEKIEKPLDLELFKTSPLLLSNFEDSISVCVLKVF